MEKNRLRAIQPECVNVVCVAPGCTNNNVNTKNVRFHSFPVTQTAQLWLAALGTEAPPSSSMEAVCSKHFRKEDYLEDRCFQGLFKDYKTHRTLKPEAVPSIFILPRPQHQTHNLEQGERKTTEEEEEDDDDDTDVMSPEAAKLYKPRVNKALGLLTQMFMKALNSSSNGVLDLNDIARELKISKRRIYDITNVLGGISLIKNCSKNVVQWVGWPPEFMDDGLRSLVVEEKKLDEQIKNAKKVIQEMHEHFLNSRLAYLTYEDIQSLPVFEDQAVLVIRAPPETKLEVAHPKEAFQIHIIGTTGPVEVLVCTDNPDISPNRNQRPKFADGDYSYVPLQGSSTAVSSKDNSNRNITQSNTTSKSPSKPPLPLSQPLNSSPKSTSVLPPLEDQLNSSSPPSSPVAFSIKEEITDLSITPDEPMNIPEHEPDQLTTDVHMTDLS